MNNERSSGEVSLVVNGIDVRVHSKNHISLLAFLRNELQLTGAKQGCATGNCGACTVLINGVATQSCQTNLTAIDHAAVETIENIALTALGEKMTDALTQRDAAQCGYCLPGIVVAAYAELLNDDRPDLVHALQHNLCRCGTHSRILNALNSVMEAQDDSA